MPLYIDGKRTFNKECYEKHKQLVRDYITINRLVRGGLLEYKHDLAETKRKIAINKAYS